MDKILKVIPRERRTFLFSATMTKKVRDVIRRQTEGVLITVESILLTFGLFGSGFIRRSRNYREQL